MIDYLVMLLSADWFKAYWTSIGIIVDPGVKTLIQQECRDIVAQILSGEEDYYLVLFSEERKSETRAMLESVAEKYHAGKAMQPTIEQWATLSDDELKAAWICADLTGDLLSGAIEKGDPRLDPEIQAVLTGTRREYDLQPFEFSMISERSETAWDKYIAGLTPNQPTMLADNLAAVLTYRRFEELWSYAQGALTSQQRNDLIAWYHTVASARSRRDLVPAYMR